MGDTSRISEEQMREALAAVAAAQDACLAEWKEFSATLPRRPNMDQIKRSAYLRGRLSGLHQTLTEFEKRAPLDIVGS